MRRFGKCVVAALVLLMVMGSICWAKPRVAVMDFDNKSQYGGWRLGRGAADILTTEMVKLDKFDMFERERLQAVLKEQDMGASGRVDPSTAAKIGKLIGVNYIIMGAVTEYGKSSRGGGGGGVRVGKTGYHSTVDIRMVNATTGRIVFADSGSNSKTSTSVRVFGFGGGEKFNEKLATETMRGAITEVAEKIATLNLSAAKSSPGGGGKALVADVEGRSLTLNKGKNAGFKTGQVLTVKRKGKVIKDPASGKVLKIKYQTVGKIKLTEVEDAYSEAQVISGAGFRVGDVIR